MTTAGGAGASTLLQCFIDVGAYCGKCRDQSAEQAGEHRQSEREGYHLPVKTNGADAGQSLRQEADANAKSYGCQCQSQHSPEDAEQQCLDKGLAQNSRSAGSQREANGDLAPAADDANQ